MSQWKSVIDFGMHGGRVASEQVSVHSLMNRSTTVFKIEYVNTNDKRDVRFNIDDIYCHRLWIFSKIEKWYFPSYPLLNSSTIQPKLFKLSLPMAKWWSSSILMIFRTLDVCDNEKLGHNINIRKILFAVNQMACCWK